MIHHYTVTSKIIIKYLNTNLTPLKILKAP